MMNDIAIQVENLSKVYSLQHPQSDADGHETLELWALKDVSFKIKKGESVGIIGPNGSGKSTLLKILAGISKPSAGKITIRGKVASILDIGAGFHPELSGRENVFLNGQLLGFSKKKIQEKFSEIVEFSGIDKFIDEPVKNYSSGMYMRLAFSIIAHLDFDVYLLDEVLSVGDAAFVKKVKSVLESKRGTCTLIMVSHKMDELSQFSFRTMLLKQGVIGGDSSNGSELIDEYLKRSNSLFAEFPVSMNASIQLMSVQTFVESGLVKIHFAFCSREGMLPSFVFSIINQRGNSILAKEYCEAPQTNSLDTNYIVVAELDASIFLQGNYTVTFIYNFAIPEQYLSISEISSFEIANDGLEPPRFQRGLIEGKVNWLLK